MENIRTNLEMFLKVIELHVFNYVTLRPTTISEKYGYHPVLNVLVTTKEFTKLGFGETSEHIPVLKGHLPTTLYFYFELDKLFGPQAFATLFAPRYAGNEDKRIFFLHHTDELASKADFIDSELLKYRILRQLQIITQYEDTLPSSTFDSIKFKEAA